jgi:hypothetical protein
MVFETSALLAPSEYAEERPSLCEHPAFPFPAAPTDGGGRIRRWFYLWRVPWGEVMRKFPAVKSCVACLRTDVATYCSLPWRGKRGRFRGAAESAPCAYDSSFCLCGRYIDIDLIDD